MSFTARIKVLQKLARELEQKVDQFSLSGSESKHPEYFELTIEVSEDTPPERIRDIVKQAALKADTAHRTHGGKGLKIDTVDIFAEKLVPERSGR